MSYLQSYEGTNPQGVTDTMCKIYTDIDNCILRLSDCIPSAGVYTLQLWVKAEANLEVALEAIGLYQSLNFTTEWIKHVFTFPTNQAGSICLSFPIGTFYLYHVKLEVGDVATDWTPAEDNGISLLSNDPPASSKLARLSDRYVDKLGCSNREWYVERNTEILTLDGTEVWTEINSGGYSISLTARGDVNTYLPALCDRFVYDTDYTSNGFYVYTGADATYLYFNPDTSVATSLAEWTAWLADNNVNVLIPAEMSKVIISSYVQSLLNSAIADDKLYIYLADNNVNNLRASLLVNPVVIGNLNGSMTAVITNNSDDEIGFIYQITCNSDVTNPTIYHVESNQLLKINGTFMEHEVITISTLRGKKSIIRSYRGINSNIINQLDSSSSWLQLQSGTNRLVQSADSGQDGMESVIIYTSEYEGV